MSKITADVFYRFEGYIRLDGQWYTEYATALELEEHGMADIEARFLAEFKTLESDFIQELKHLTQKGTK